LRKEEAKVTDKLFKVTIDTHRAKPFFVIAADAGEAYSRVRTDLDKQDLYFKNERSLRTVELIAESSEYPENGSRLYAREVA
jgi:hypothetical protein